MTHFNGKRDYTALIEPQQSIRRPLLVKYEGTLLHFHGWGQGDYFLTFMFPQEDVSLPVFASCFKNSSQGVSSQRGDIL